MKWVESELYWLLDVQFWFIGNVCAWFYDRIAIICCWLLQGEPGAMGLPGLEGLPGAKVSNPDLTLPQKVYPPMFQTEIKTSRMRELLDVSEMLIVRS